VNTPLRRSIAVAAVVLAPTLSACGGLTGFDNPTDVVYNPGVGVNDRSGTVDVLHALVVSGADGSGTVVATLANNDQTEEDALTRLAGAGDDSGASVSLDGPLDIPAGGSAQLFDAGEVFIEGDTIEAGTFVELTFTFEQSETVTLEVPVVARRGDFSDVPVPSVAPTPATEEEEGEASSAH